jgi:hypothetical protein
MTVTGPIIGAGTDQPAARTSVQFVVPTGVNRTHTGIFCVVWAASVSGEVPPTVAPVGSGWTTLSASRTIGTLGWAMFSRTGLLAGDVVAFTLSATRVPMGLDFYVSGNGTPVVGTVTDRPGTQVTNTAAGMATTEASEYVLAVSLERSTANGTLVTDTGGTTALGFLEGQLGSGGSVYVGRVTAPGTPGTTSTVTLTYNGTPALNGAALQIAFPAAVAAGLHPTTELVAVAWLKAAVPYLGARVATELPTDNTSWSASGFTTVGPAGGSPDIYLPVSKPVVSLDCWGVSPNSGKPPWNLAAQQAEEIRRAALAHASAPQAVSLPAAYRSARVMNVIPRSEPRRIPGDAASYARFQMDLEIWWVEV